MTARTGKLPDVYVEEVVFLRSCGSSDRAILTALGVSAAALSRALYRADRADLARPFNRIQRQERRSGCPSCGSPHAVERRSRTGLCYACVVPLLTEFQAEAATRRRTS